MAAYKGLCFFAIPQSRNCAVKVSYHDNSTVFLDVLIEIIHERNLVQSITLSLISELRSKLSMLVCEFRMLPFINK